MFKTLRNALKVEDIRKKLLYTFMMLIVIRIGAQVPVPGANIEAFQAFLASMQASAGDAWELFNAMTGGSFENLSIFALSISPYITSSIIMQLLTIAIPKLEELQKDGEEGRKKIAELTRYVTVALALIQSIAMGIGFQNQGYIDDGFFAIVQVVAAFTAGSAVLMWIGEQITEKGLGNGISIVLVINIISRIPSDMLTLFNQFVIGNKVAMAAVATLIILAIILFTVVFTVFLQDGERRIPVQYSKRVQGRKMVGGQSSHIPLKVNVAGVIPVIFASSLMSFPVVIANLIGKTPTSGFWMHVFKGLQSSSWVKPGEWIYSIGLLVYILLCIFFAYFYTSISFNPLEVADNMKKQGGTIPGIRSGKPTADYLAKILNYIIFIGVIGLLIVCVIPIIFSGIFNANVSFGGTSLIIIVSVILETIKELESQLVVRNYKGFLKK